MKRILSGIFFVAMASSLLCAATAADIPIISQQPASLTVTNGGTAVFNVAVSGTGPFTYQWRINGANLCPTITTVAGGGYGYHPEATNSALEFPTSVALDGAGNLFFADSGDGVVRKVDPNGMIKTVAGNISPGDSGDGGPATNAELRDPSSIALDGSGNLFIADSGNYRIRKVDTNGIIRTIAGKGIEGYSGDGGPATNATLRCSGIALDGAGNLFIADSGNHRIRKIDSNGIISTIAGNGTSGFSGDGGPAINAKLNNPAGVACESTGNLFIADSDNNCIRKIDLNGNITTVAGNGTSGYSGDGGRAIDAKLDNATGIAFDSTGGFYIADRHNSRIRRVDAIGIIRTVAGFGPYGNLGDGGPATSASLSYPMGVVSDGRDNLYIADTSNIRIRKISHLPSAIPTLTLANASLPSAGDYSVVVSTPYGNATSQVATLTVLMPASIESHPTNQPVPVGGTATFSVTASGTEPLNYFWFRNGKPIPGSNASTFTTNNLSLLDSGAQFTCMVSNTYGSATSRVATLSVGIPPSVLQQPISHTVTNHSTAEFSVTVSGTGPFTYQWQFNGTNLVPTITTVAGNKGSGYSGDGGPATNAKLNYPVKIALDNADNLFIADRGNNRIRKVDDNGIITTAAGSGIVGFSGDGGPASNARLNTPRGVALDNAGNLFISDAWNFRIRKVAVNGVITTVAGGGSYPNLGEGGPATAAYVSPYGIVVDAVGNLFLGDGLRVRKVDANGIIKTVAGDGDCGFSGDGGPATRAKLTPIGLEPDALGNLFIADGNNRIRKVDTFGIIRTIAGGGTNYAGDGGPATNAALYCSGVALDRDGNMFLTDSRRICKVDTNGIISTVAGGGTNDPGDNGPALQAGILPVDVKVNTAGDLLIAEDNYHRVRKVKYLSATAPTLKIGDVPTNNAGAYSVIVSSPYGTTTSQVATLTVLTRPNITSQPTNQTVLIDKPATFRVVASGDAPLTYSWFRDGVPVSGAHDPSYSIPRVLASHSGVYITCVVSNSCGCVTSQVATLSVAFPPKVVQHPTVRTNGNTATFSVAVSGTGPFAYQWQLNGTNVAPVITRIAGTGAKEYSGDGGLALYAGLSSPTSLAFDTAGNLFISDSGNSRVRKVGTNGIITTVAGTETFGYSGDGGLATDAQLRSPRDLAFDQRGNLFVNDANNYRVRRVDTDGIISTVAGIGKPGMWGDYGPATDAELSPQGIAVDTMGNLLISDFYTASIRKVDAAGILSTIAGTGAWDATGDGHPATNATLYRPSSLAVDTTGNLFIADQWNSRIRKVDAEGIITTVAGGGTNYPGDGGPAVEARVYCSGIAFDARRNLYIAGRDLVRKVDTRGIITTIAGGGTNYPRNGVPATDAKLGPTGIAVDSTGNLFIADSTNNVILKVTHLSATAPTFTLQDLNPAYAGNYSVIATSPFGSVTSSIVKLTLSTVLPPQEFTGVLTQETNLALQFKAGTPNYPYILQTTTNLTPPISWEFLLTNWTDTSGLWNLTVSNAPAFPARFYRILGQ